MTPTPGTLVLRRTDGGITSVRIDLTDIGPLVIVDGHYPDDVLVDDAAARCGIIDYDPRSLVGGTAVVIRRESVPAFGTWEQLDAWPE